MADTTKPAKPYVQPYAHTRMAKFLTAQLAALVGVTTQREVAAALGYPKANIISMFKAGETKVPLEKYPALAQVLGVELLFILRLGLEQYWPGSVKAVNDAFSRLMTANEEKLVKVYREAVGDEDWSIPEETLEVIRKQLKQAKDSFASRPNQ